jgi:hypothetical protein
MATCNKATLTVSTSWEGLGVFAVTTMVCTCVARAFWPASIFASLHDTCFCSALTCARSSAILSTVCSMRSSLSTSEPGAVEADNDSAVEGTGVRNDVDVVDEAPAAAGRSRDAAALSGSGSAAGLAAGLEGVAGMAEPVPSVPVPERDTVLEPGAVSTSFLRGATSDDGEADVDFDPS